MIARALVAVVFWALAEDAGARPPKTSDIATVDAHPAQVCRRLQRAAQSAMAARGNEALELEKRPSRRPRRVLRSLVGEALRPQEVSRGCHRCIVRQFARRVPVAEQRACGAHHQCVEGRPLPPGLGPCVATVIMTLPACESQAWDATCVAAAARACEGGCAPCSHDVCEPGAPLTANCSPCAAQVCASDPFCCDTSWSDECVAKVATVCDLVCPVARAVASTTTSTSSSTSTTTTLPPTTVPGTGPTTTSVGPTSTVVPSPTTTAPGPTTTGAPSPPPTTVPGPTTTTSPSPPTTVVPGPTTTTAPGPTTTTVPSPPTTIMPGPTSTIVSGPPTTIIPGPTSTMLPGPTSTIPPGATTTVPSAPGTTTTPVPPTTTLGETPVPGEGCTDVINFDERPGGTIVSQAQTSLGRTVLVKGTNPKLGPSVNAAVLYDSDCSGGRCTGGDDDLGSPNEAFGGPGIGAGGAAGRGRNDQRLVRVLIVASDLVDTNGDGLVDDPDDQGTRTVSQELDFSTFAPATVKGLTYVDFEDAERGGVLQLFDVNGASIGRFTLPPNGNNGVTRYELPEAVTGVWKMIVVARGSAAIDDVGLGCVAQP